MPTSAKRHSVGNGVYPRKLLCLIKIISPPDFPRHFELGSVLVDGYLRL